ncbi:hypothetical protein GOBAR_AA37968 [Gossypium barbadense]|uniref:Methyltransferase type 11 domain-containing protein n=1 Tax=Gossypium barbadense TaxID=3634 RepID=A0A2P5VVA4_GOSBA|nr:hypothetical protein GOBAR_AA37968 [Gossypium barbadense]
MTTHGETAATSTLDAHMHRACSLQEGIAEFYDQSSGLWEDIWGDHMHHGFYDPDSNVSGSDHPAAQIRMIEESLRFAGITEQLIVGTRPVAIFWILSISQEVVGVAGFMMQTAPESLFADDPAKQPKTIVDVGCGIGGSSRYLARKFGAECQGITLSPVQAGRANVLAKYEGLADKVSFQVADALKQPFPDGQFDLVWCMESGEHMPDKAKFVNELARVAAPGGTIIIVTWCHRDLGPSEEDLEPWEKKLLNRICNAYYLPEWCSTSDYVKLLQSLSLQDIKAADWSERVAPFWPAVICSAFTWKGFISLLRSGLKAIKGALVMPLMIQGYQKGVIKFAIITCRKPEDEGERSKAGISCLKYSTIFPINKGCLRPQELVYNNPTSLPHLNGVGIDNLLLSSAHKRNEGRAKLSLTSTQLGDGTNSQNEE